jgi:hypothetical protein
VIMDTIGDLFQQILDFTALFVIPNWEELIALLPVFLLLLVVGPLVSLLALAWLRYGILKPRSKAVFAELHRAAPLDADGRPVFPRGEPYSLAEGMIYEPGAVRSQTGDDLLVACPKCGLVRGADLDTCGNCGLSFTLKPVTRSLRPAGPPPGGAAAA